MRIISGKWKGKVFNTKLPVGIRPTQDAMRETIFNILKNYIDFEDAICADICAGTGMLGIEALSRGARKVYFIDKNTKSINLIRENLISIKEKTSNYKILNLDASQFIRYYEKIIFSSNIKEKLNLIFTDPPYNSPIINNILQLIPEKNILATDGIIVAETAIFSQTLIDNDNYKILTERQFGASKIIFLKYSSG